MYAEEVKPESSQSTIFVIQTFRRLALKIKLFVACMSLCHMKTANSSPLSAVAAEANAAKSFRRCSFHGGPQFRSSTVEHAVVSGHVSRILDSTNECEEEPPDLGIAIVEMCN